MIGSNYIHWETGSDSYIHQSFACPASPPIQDGIVHSGYQKADTFVSNSSAHSTNRRHVRSYSFHSSFINYSQSGKGHDVIPPDVTSDTHVTATSSDPDTKLNRTVHYMYTKVNAEYRASASAHTPALIRLGLFTSCSIFYA